MLVTQSELERYMDIKFSNRQTHAAEYVLEGLESELESILRRPISVKTFNESYTVDYNSVGVPTSSFFYDYSLDTTGNIVDFYQPPFTLYLKHSPVVSVASIVVTAPFPTATPMVLVEGTDYVVRRFGVDIWKTFANDTIDIEYTAGLDGSAIKIFKLLILRAASREMQNMHDDVVGIKDLETRNVAPLVTGFTPEEIVSIKRYRRVRIS